MQFFSSLADLYASLDDPTITKIEAAAKARRLGRFVEARAILSDHATSNSPLAVALECAQLELQLGFEVSNLEIISRSLEQGVSAFSPSERLLLRFRQCAASLNVHGHLREALTEARKLKLELEEIPLSTWTDIEFDCVIAYFSVLVLGYTESKWVNEDEDLFLRPEGQTFSVKALQDHMISVGKYSSCLDLQDKAQRLLPVSVTPLRWLELLHCYEKHQGPPSELRALLLIRTELAIAGLFLTNSDVVSAAKHVNIAHSRLLEAHWVKEQDSPYITLKILQILTSNSLLMVKIKNLFTLVEQIRVNGDRILETEIMGWIFVMLYKVDVMARGESWIDLGKQLVAAVSQLHDSDLIEPLAKCRNMGFRYDLNMISNNHVLAVSCLTRVAQFEADYPRFYMPLASNKLYQAAAAAAHSLKKQDLFSMYNEKFVKSNLDIKPSMHDNFFRYRILHDPPAWISGIFAIILGWLYQDITDKVISVNVARKILLLPRLQGIEDSLAEFKKQIAELPENTLANSLFGSPVPVNPAAWQERLQRYRTWLFFYCRRASRPHRHAMLGDLQRIRSNRFNAYNYSQIAIPVTNYQNPEVRGAWNDLQLRLRLEVLSNAEYDLELMKHLDPGSLPAFSYILKVSESLVMSSRQDLHNSSKAFVLGHITDKILEECQTWYQRAYGEFSPLNASSKFHVLYMLADCLRYRYYLFGSVPADASIDVLRRYEDDFTKQRQAKTVLRGVDDLTARTAFWTSSMDTQHCEHAMADCMEALGIGSFRKSYHLRLQRVYGLPEVEPSLPIPSRSQDELRKELANWAQRKKARTVTEVSGTGIVIPRYLLQQVSLDPEAVSLMEEESALQAQLNENCRKPLEIQSLLDKVHDRMRQCTTLEQVMRLRDGKAIDLDGIQQLSKTLGENTLIADYIHVFVGLSGIPQEFGVMLYRSGKLVDVHFVDAKINSTALKKWVATLMTKEKPLNDDEEEAHDSLQYLFPLIEPLLNCSKPGETILISPTGLLNRIPLHAIEIDEDQPLIARNKIIYTQSLTLFTYTLRQFQLKQSSPPLAVSALGNRDAARKEAPSMDFATGIAATLLSGSALTKNVFLEAVKERSLVHFFGHFEFQEKTPLESRLLIGDTEQITVRDLFNIRLLPGSHVTIIGCGSGRSDIGIQDNLLGLSTALFYAGAGSVISAQWKILMQDGDRFQEAFYKNLLEQSLESRFLDFAAALQSAVLEVRKDSNGNVRSPYHWASFTLQGCWNNFPSFPRKNEEMDAAFQRLTVDIPAIAE